MSMYQAHKCGMTGYGWTLLYHSVPTRDVLEQVIRTAVVVMFFSFPSKKGCGAHILNVRGNSEWKPSRCFDHTAYIH